MPALFRATIFGTAALLLAPRTCPAAPATEAATLFEQGRQLLKEGQLEEACAALNRSFQLEATPGTLLNLADCEERTHHPAAAYRDFRRTAELAKQQAWLEMVQEAQRRAELLASTFPKLTLVVPRRVEQLVVELNDVPLTAAELDRAQTVPPGRVEVRAKAPGFRPWTIELTLAEDRTIVVPELERSVKAPPSRLALVATGPARPAPAAWAPWAVVGVGGGALGAAVVTGLWARKKHQELADGCPTTTTCPDDLESTRTAGKRLALATDVLWISGTAAVGGGLVWYFLTRHEPSATGLRVTPVLASNATVALLSGSF